MAENFKKSPLSAQVDLSKFAPATDEEKRQQDVMGESSRTVCAACGRTPWRWALSWC